MNTSSGYRLPDTTHWPPRFISEHEQVPGARYTIIRLDVGHFIWKDRLEDGTAAVFKMYWGRGIGAWLRAHAGRFRVQREFDTLSRLQARGVPCSRPLFWSKGASASYGNRFELLVTEEIPAAVPLHQWLERIDPARAGEELHKACALIRRMHAAGVHHGAMHPRNILVSAPEAGEAGTSTPFIIDVPKAVVLSGDIAGSPLADIDLMDFAAKVSERADREAVIAGLQGYGMSATEAEAFMHSLRRRRRGKQGRNINRARALLAGLLSR